MQVKQLFNLLDGTRHRDPYPGLTELESVHHGIKIRWPGGIPGRDPVNLYLLLVGQKDKN